MHNDQLLEKAITLKDVQRLYKIIGQNDFIDLILPNEIDKIVIKRKLNNNESFEDIGQAIGLSKPQTLKVYENSIRKIKQQVRKFINYYIAVKTNNIESPHLKTIENKLKNEDPSKLKKTNNQDLLISNFVNCNIKWVNALKDRGIITIGDLLKYTRKDLLLIPGIGSQSIVEIEYLLSHYNFKLRVNYNTL